MIPVMCQTNDDCVRACIASILELPSADVPNWFANEPEDGQFHMQGWLAEIEMIGACVALPGEWSFDRMKGHMQETYPDRYYMLWCDSGGDHAVIGRGNEIVWNPAWYKSPIDGPHSLGVWIVWIIARL